MAAPNFIGIDNVKHVADQLQPNIVMGPAYFSKDELKRLGFKIITGVQFKNTAMVLNRKGGTSRRKVVGTPIESKIGYLTERVMTARIVWNRYRHNEDEFQEKPIAIEGGAKFHYPLTEEMINAIGMTFSEDVYANLFFGDENSNVAELSLYDGIHTNINKDIENGDISQARGNLIPCDVIDDPQTEGDDAAWKAWVAWYDQWSPALKRVQVLCYMSIANGHAIANAYGQHHRNLKEVNYLPDANGNFKVPEYPKVTFVPSDDFGKGTRMVATIPGNFEFGVNSEGDESFVGIQHGSDEDIKDIIFQIQGIYGTRVLNILPSHFVTNGGVIEDCIWQGDYKKDSYTAVPNDPEKGTVTISPAAVDGEYAKGTTLTLTAAAKTGATFKNWSNGATTAQITVVKGEGPEGIVAIFE
jgi:hypothetical protein